MQFALRDLFTARQAKGGLLKLALDDYLERGGLGQALERYANQAFDQLSPGEQELARWVFSGLVQPGRGTQDTARRARFEELAPAGVPPAEVESLISKLADARLVTTEEGEGERAGVRSVSLAHERLLEAWSWLDRLVDENCCGSRWPTRSPTIPRNGSIQATQLLRGGSRWRRRSHHVGNCFNRAGRAFIQAAVQRRDASSAAGRCFCVRFNCSSGLALWHHFKFYADGPSPAATAVYFGAAETEAAAPAQQRAVAHRRKRKAEQQRTAGANARLALSRPWRARRLNQTSDEVGLLLAAASGTRHGGGRRR
jgi:hypothetical protein